MCGKFALKGSLQEICAIFGVSTALTVWPDEGDAFPGQSLPVIIKDRMGAALWGWPAPVAGSRDFINIRSETVAEKASFATDWKAGRRCVIPAHGFYEWDDNKTPYFINFADAPVVGLCGLWSRRPDGQVCFGILTRGATPDLASIHARMPMAVVPSQARGWLESGETPPALPVFVKSLAAPIKVG